MMKAWRIELVKVMLGAELVFGFEIWVKKVGTARHNETHRCRLFRRLLAQLPCRGLGGCVDGCLGQWFGPIVADWLKSNHSAMGVCTASALGNCLLPNGLKDALSSPLSKPMEAITQMRQHGTVERSRTCCKRCAAHRARHLRCTKHKRDRRRRVDNFGRAPEQSRRRHRKC